MALGYYYPLFQGAWGQPQPGDPVAQAELQDAAAQATFKVVNRPGFVPQSYLHLGGGNVVTPGWTAQKDTQSPFPPYDPNVGRIPDWTGDSNSLAAGRWDQTPLWSGWPVNRINRAPIGVSPHQGTELEPKNPAVGNVVGTFLPGFNEW